MNCTYPLEESILMDYVPKKTRARWKSLEAVSMFGWCGSALVGGVLADKLHSYTKTFLITIGLQASGLVLYARLLGVVRREAPGKAVAGNLAAPLLAAAADPEEPGVQ